MADEEVYLVRGALLACEKGSHPRRLNLPMCHGAYSEEKPLISETDCTEENIKYFGVCCSETPPEGAEVKQFEPYVPEGQEGNQGSQDPIEGPVCKPDIVGKWRECNGTTVTSNSYLVCSCGGIIYPCSSGHEYND